MGHMNPVPVPLEGSRTPVALIQMVLLTLQKLDFEKGGGGSNQGLIV